MLLSIFKIFNSIWIVGSWQEHFYSASLQHFFPVHFWFIKYFYSGNCLQQYEKCKVLIKDGIMNAISLSLAIVGIKRLDDL